MEYQITKTIRTSTAYIGLGTNIGDRDENLKKASKLIMSQCGEIAQQSSVYETRPLPSPEKNQTRYLNLVLELRTILLPRELLGALQQIESKMGRTRETELYWGSRIIDIDIIAYEEECVDEPGLQIPHPSFYKRDFVLIPLQEIAPDFIDPRSKIPIHILVNDLHDEDKTILHRKAPHGL